MPVSQSHQGSTAQMLHTGILCQCPQLPQQRRYYSRPGPGLRSASLERRRPPWGAELWNQKAGFTLQEGWDGGIQRQLLLQRPDIFRLFYVPWPCVTIAAATTTLLPGFLSISTASFIFRSFPLPPPPIPGPSSLH